MPDVSGKSDEGAGSAVPRSSRAAALVITATFLALVFLPGVYHFAFGLRTDDLRRWGGWLTREPAADAVRKIEEDFDRRFLLAHVTRTLVSGVPVEALRPNQPDVVAGPRGYLYYGVDAQVPITAGFLDARLGRGSRAADAILDLHAQLRARGVHLLLVPIPAKASLYPEQIDPSYDVSRGPDLNVHHAAWIEKLRAAGVDVLDLTDLFWARRYDAEGGIYHPTDAHWTHHAIRLAGGRIAERIKPLLSDVPPAGPFRTRFVDHARPGDLLAMDASHPDAVLHADVRERHLQVYDDGGPVRPGDDAPVVVIGDSFSAFYEDTGASLSHQIMASLGVPVQSKAIVGGTGDSMRAALRDSPQGLRNKKAVVFAFTLRLLVCCEWQRVPLDPAVPAPPRRR